MPSRRSPVTIARAIGSKSSTTSTLMAAACHAAGISQVSATGAVLIPAPAYNHNHGNDNRGRRAAQAIRLHARTGRDDVHRQARPDHRLHRPERCGEIHHDAGNPQPGRPRRGARADRRPALCQPAGPVDPGGGAAGRRGAATKPDRSEEHTSELQSRSDLVCRLLLEKKKKKYYTDCVFTYKNPHALHL